jgi:succinylarginine dihydrolase
MAINRSAYEVNFDGIVGPTHNYSGLSYGNIASEQNRYAYSNPKEAALQGLEKMKFLADLGIKQGVLPPHERPHIPSLKNIGFHGSDAEILASAFNQNPEILFSVSSAAAMWTANAATITPSIDSSDNRVQITPANLISKFHRSIEAQITGKVLKAIFRDPHYFRHHASLPQSLYFADEGAANHNRFCKEYGETGVELFVFGCSSFASLNSSPKIYPARQTLEASQATARLHGIDRDRVIFAQQNPKAIDAGAFHNDVVGVANKNVFLFHEEAFINKNSLIDEIRQKVMKHCKAEMIFLEIKAKDISLKDAVDTYLFNSQLISLPSGGMVLIAPLECQKHKTVNTLLEHLATSASNPIADVHYLDLKQSMQNGGGPACLRLRATLTDEEIKAASQQIFLNESLYGKLKEWINKYYRDRLQVKDLADPQLLMEGRRALDELTKLLGLGPLYDFQKEGAHAILS